MSKTADIYTSHLTNYVWQDYLAKQLLIPLVTDVYNPNKLYLTSSHYIKEYECVKHNDNDYVVRVILSNNNVFYFPTITESYSEITECYKLISLIGIGRLEISVQDWLCTYPKFKSNFTVIEWEKYE